MRMPDCLVLAQVQDEHNELPKPLVEFRHNRVYQLDGGLNAWAAGHVLRERG